MKRSIGHVAFLVRDYDEAIAYFTQACGFTLLEDTPQGDGKRWVVVAPSASSEPSLLLARAVGAEEQAAVGNQSGGRVFLFLRTDDFWRDYEAMRSRRVAFKEVPREESYGVVAVFADLYGNKWDLIQRR
jgi:catechol 2,3-dioxygenase-like lactoylglutathione lyase family enzyme